MKIAITADNHLAEKDLHPERYETFGNILVLCDQIGIDRLIVAGDLFDKNLTNYVEFESICRDCNASHLPITIIPGNHDYLLSNERISLSGLEIVETPTSLSISSDQSILFIPYKADTTMGEILSETKAYPSTQTNILIAHGDWTEGLHNSYEQGGYMPLTQLDILQHHFVKVFLGHIHLPYDSKVVHYPGSPCPLDITETGLRRILVYDTEKKDVSTHIVESPIIFYNESFVVLPDDDGIPRLKQEIKKRIAEWDCPEEWIDRIRVRVKIKGVTGNQNLVREEANRIFAPYQLYDEEGIIVTDLHQMQDMGKAYLAQQMQTWIEKLDWPSHSPEPTKDEILMQALSFIYGV